MHEEVQRKVSETGESVEVEVGVKFAAGTRSSPKRCSHAAADGMSRPLTTGLARMWPKCRVMTARDRDEPPLRLDANIAQGGVCRPRARTSEHRPATGPLTAGHKGSAVPCSFGPKRTYGASLGYHRRKRPGRAGHEPLRHAGRGRLPPLRRGRGAEARRAAEAVRRRVPPDRDGQSAPGPRSALGTRHVARWRVRGKSLMS